MLPSIAGPVSEGDQLAALRALRDRLAAEIDASLDGRVTASLSRQLTDVLERIDELAPPKPKAVTVRDEIAARRRAKGLPGADRKERGARRS